MVPGQAVAMGISEPSVASVRFTEHTDRFAASEEAFWGYSGGPLRYFALFLNH